MTHFRELLHEITLHQHNVGFCEMTISLPGVDFTVTFIDPRAEAQSAPAPVAEDPADVPPTDMIVGKLVVEERSGPDLADVTLEDVKVTEKGFDVSTDGFEFG